MAPKKVSFDPETQPPEDEQPEEMEIGEDDEPLEDEDEDEPLEDDEDGLEDEDDEGMDMALGMDLGAILATEDGDTICTALLDINDTLGQMAQQLSVTNKILVKMMSKMK